MPESITFIHAADVHLGRSFLDLGRRGARMRECIGRAFARTVDLALDRRVDLFLVAGDLFDRPDPPREALALLEAALGRLADAGIESCIIPGTHDPPRARVWSSPLFVDRPRLTVLSPSRLSATIERLGVALSAWFPEPDTARLWRGPAEGWHHGLPFRIALLHGSAFHRGDGDGPDDLLPAEVLADPDINYFALGHHHGAGPVDKVRAPAYYSGSPEMLAVDQKDAGHALWVQLRRAGESVEAKVEKVRVGELVHQAVRLDAPTLTSALLERELDGRRNPNLFLDVTLEGILPLDQALPDLEEIVRRREADFFRLRILNKVERSDAILAEAEYPAGSVTAEFIRRCRETIRRSEGAERAEWEEALALGLHYLSGGDRS